MHCFTDTIPYVYDKFIPTLIKTPSCSSNVFFVVLEFNIHMDFRKFVACFVCILLSFPPMSYQLLHNKMTKTRRFDPSQAVTLSWDPRVFIYRGFLSDEECDHLINLALEGTLEKSMVTDENGTSSFSEDRTSSGVFLSNAQDEIVADIESRIATWTFLPEENGEAMQILRYKLGEKYDPHYDFYSLKSDDEPGGLRYATVLMYLSDVVKGGETIFPNSTEKLFQPKDDSWSECAKKGYAVKPRKGDALLFFSLHLDGTTDENSLHASCPVTEGEKWSATKWIHVSTFEFCLDRDAKCPLWAQNGLCTQKPDFMVGSPTSPGYCRKSCNVCS